MTKSMPSISSLGKMDPQSTTTISSSYSKTVMFLPISSTPPRETIRSLLTGAIVCLTGNLLSKGQENKNFTIAPASRCVRSRRKKPIHWIFPQKARQHKHRSTPSAKSSSSHSNRLLGQAAASRKTFIRRPHVVVSKHTVLDDTMSIYYSTAFQKIPEFSHRCFLITF